MNSTERGNSYDANSNPSSGCDEGGASGQFHPSAKLVEKMQKLSKWRIDPSLIDFLEDAPELHGGHATVSRAMLRSSFSKSGDLGETDNNSDSGSKVVAVKKLKLPADESIEQLLGLTLREAGFLVELSHSNIIKLEGFVEDASKGTVWLVFPWEANGNLRDFIASQDWEIPERLSLIDDVARGVEYLHNQNPPICHGDLKSVNILVNSYYRAVITDFGSARRLIEGDPHTETEPVVSGQQLATRLEATFCAATNTITLTGNEFTLRWAAPELLNDEPPTPKVDIWALGWIAYEVMTNSIPFEDIIKDSIVIRRVTQGHLPLITGDARMSLMLQLCWLMSECWRIDPSQRPTAIACRKALTWMPMIVPDSTRAAGPVVSEARSPSLLIQLGEMYRHQGDYANASKLYTEALRIFTSAADRQGRAEALERLSALQLLQGNYEGAIVSYSDALEIFTGIDDRRKKADALLGLAQAYTYHGKESEAIPFYSEVLKLYTDINYTYGRASALFGLAGVHRIRGEHSQAVPLYMDALQLWTDIGNRQGRASALWGLAEAHRSRHESTEAIKFYSDALQIYTDIGDTRGRAVALTSLAGVSSEQGRPKDAIEFYEKASKIWEQIGDASILAYTLRCIADARQQMELVEEAA
ncbi:hypothetical protein FS837_004821 [Tulasnella sp. UAMH 9824]|nr:hypothetical protein FS837_004821 [Tulasnella sp. UAMH 9824]